MKQALKRHDPDPQTRGPGAGRGQNPKILGPTRPVIHGLETGPPVPKSHGPSP